MTIEIVIGNNKYIVTEEMAAGIDKILQEAVNKIPKDQIQYGVNINSWGTRELPISDLTDDGPVQNWYKTDRWRWFICPEDRQEYIEYEKPCLNQKEVNDIILDTLRKTAYESSVALEYKEAIKCAIDNYVMEKLKTQ